MTAQVAVMNKRAVALATDSAVTINGGSKIYDSANKLFMLSKKQPVGIMVYSNAEFLRVPWDIIIKGFRNYIESKKFDYLGDYKREFMEYIKSKSDEFELGKTFSVRNIYSMILEDIYVFLRSNYTERYTGAEDFNELIFNILKEYDDIIKNERELYAGFDNLIGELTNYKQSLNQMITKRFGSLSKRNFNLIKQICRNSFKKDRYHNAISTGVVIAGYGEKEIFPVLENIEISTMIGNSVVYKKNDKIAINERSDSYVHAFAQKETVNTYLWGINDRYINSFDGIIKETVIPLSNDIGKDMVERILANWQKGIEKILADARTDNIKPFMDAIRSLPKSELGNLAESLVDLTSIKRRFTINNLSNTVGGPIDVAIISKDDGFIWCKRKHYFEADLNHHFFKNYYEG
ncbi:MAG: hypothetical protein N4A47_03955 [Clostridia bacterium]|jgi:hypothetical protein|nr:hypothetical protein [Clostridia bacterium]